MTIDKAFKLKIGQYIQFPEDRGNHAGSDRVVSISKGIKTNIHGSEYIWVGTKSHGVWPSNILSLKVVAE